MSLEDLYPLGRAKEAHDLCLDSHAIVQPVQSLADRTFAQRSTFVIESGDVSVARQQDNSSEHNSSVPFTKIQLQTRISHPVSPQDQMPDLEDPECVWVKVRREDLIQTSEMANRQSHASASPAHTPVVEQDMSPNHSVPPQAGDSSAFPAHVPLPMTVTVSPLPPLRKSRPRAVIVPRAGAKYRMVICEHCLEEYQACLLARHIRDKHTREKNFKCEGCGRLFGRLEQLRSHQSKLTCANGVCKERHPRRKRFKDPNGSG